jgi:hypothetical protein
LPKGGISLTVNSVAKRGHTSRRSACAREVRRKKQNQNYLLTWGQWKFPSNVRQHTPETAAVFVPNTWDNFGTICSPNHAHQCPTGALSHCGVDRENPYFYSLI